MFGNCGEKVQNFEALPLHSTAIVARGCSGDLHYDRPRNLPSNPPELLCICIVRVYTESYVDSQNSLFCLLTCNNDHKSLYMPILWYVIISPNSILKSFEVHNSCLNHKNLALKFREIVVVEKAVDVVSYTDFIAMDTGRNERNKSLCDCVKD